MVLNALQPFSVNKTFGESGGGCVAELGGVLGVFSPGTKTSTYTFTQ